MAVIQVTTSIGAALAAAGPGDVVEVPAGVYSERVVIKADGVTLRGHDGAIVDGGYSHAAAKTGGSSWRDLKYKAPSGGDGIVVAADNVTVENLTVRNCPDSGLSAGTVKSMTVRGCTFDHVYGTGIKVNGGSGPARDILIENNRVNAASVRIFDDTRVYSDPQGVSGSIKVGDAVGVVIRGNVVTNGFGEGINLGKNITDFVCEKNVVSDCNHKYFYCNSATGGMVRGNVAYCTGHPAHLWVDNEAPAGLAVKDETTRTPYSGDIVYENNVAVNCGIPVEVNPRGSGAVTVRRNTFVWGPQTRRGPWVSGGRVTVEGNIFAVTKGGPGPTGSPAKAGGNLWTVQPPTAWRHADDVIDDPEFNAPDMPRTPVDPFGLIAPVGFDILGFRPRWGSPAIRDGKAAFGALEPLPLDPPVDPPPPPPPPPPPDEPGPLDVAAALAAVDAALSHLDNADGAIALAAATLSGAAGDVAKALDRLDALKALLESAA